VPVPALLRYRKRFFSAGPARDRTRLSSWPAALKEPGRAIRQMNPSHDSQIRFRVNRAWVWRMAAELVLLLLPPSRPLEKPLVLRVLRPFVNMASRLSTSGMTPCQRLRSVCLDRRRGFRRVARGGKHTSQENVCPYHSMHRFLLSVSTQDEKEAVSRSLPSRAENTFSARSSKEPDRLYGHAMHSSIGRCKRMDRCFPPPPWEDGVSQAGPHRHPPGTHPQSELVERFTDSTSQNDAD